MCRPLIPKIPNLVELSRDVRSCEAFNSQCVHPSRGNKLRTAGPEWKCCRQQRTHGSMVPAPWWLKGRKLMVSLHMRRSGPECLVVVVIVVVVAAAGHQSLAWRVEWAEGGWLGWSLLLQRAGGR